MSKKERDALAYIQKENIAKISTGANDDKHEVLMSQMRQYEIYRDNYATNIVFDQTNTNLSKGRPPIKNECLRNTLKTLFLASENRGPSFPDWGEGGRES